ncbi:hypothetical protein P691DRAFT_702393 [Macrolepiota fuliginosa MF-IS2]|uniref:DUF6534 domain-containing protein n=1 Tax=Macrolepiota fuliginosa MF-IS2 TaxID=1400762 RepID=A0A9P5XFA6_9AGAR|nr:hypothetical protein P691DRAFT_702393 [Macrolepiota fuliginosa MF-IS2]
MFLFGITTVQTYLYYLAFPNDRMALKYLVYGIHAIGTFQTGLTLHDLFVLYVSRYGYIKPKMPNDQPDWNSGLYFIVTIPICGSIVSCAVQLFYADRIRRLTGHIFIPSLLCALAMLQCAGAIMVAAGTYPPQIGNKDPGPPDGAPQQMNGIGFIGSLLWSSTSSACDVLIAICMLFHLWKLREFVMHSELPGRISKLMIIIVETGTLTAVVAISFILTFLLAPGGFFMIPGLSVGKFYAISLLAILNNRFRIVGGRQRQDPFFIVPSTPFEVDTITSSTPHFVSVTNTPLP